MYADVDTLVNRDLPWLYTHFVPLMDGRQPRLVKGDRPFLHRAFPATPAAACAGSLGI